MRTISSEARAALNSGRFEYRALVKLAPEGTAPFCVWDDRGDIAYGGDTFIGKPVFVECRKFIQRLFGSQSRRDAGAGR